MTVQNLRDDIVRTVEFALAEDIGSGDITAELIPAEQTANATIITRDDCVMCGRAWADETFSQLGGIHPIDWQVNDGDAVKAGTALAHLSGNTRSLLTGERTALNFLQTLSGTATKAARYAQALGDANIRLLDTRKTIPGLRAAQKYAVVTGGCRNHRMGLFDAFLIKENHIVACGGITQAITRARHLHPQKTVEVEVETLAELEEALSAAADIIMLDNFSHDMYRAAQQLDKRESQYEVSGNLSLTNIGELKPYNIDYISFGALTKHVEAVDLSFRIEER